MSNGGKAGRLPEPAAKPQEAGEESAFVPRRGVAAEREAAAAQIARTVKVWRKVADDKKGDEKKDEDEEKKEAEGEEKDEKEAPAEAAEDKGEGKEAEGGEKQGEEGEAKKVHAKLEPGAKVFRAVDPKMLALAKKYGLNASSPTSLDILNNLGMTCQAFITAYRKSTIQREFPAEFLPMTVQAALDADKSKVRKLLTDGRFAK